MILPSPSLPPFRWTLALCLAAFAGAATVTAQDRLVFKDNPSHIQEGKIVGLNGNTVLINVATTSGAGQMGFDLGMISRIDSPPPPAFQAAQRRVCRRAMGQGAGRAETHR